MAADREAAFAALVAHARATEDVLALFVFGSRGRGVLVDERSDYDVGVVLRDEAALARFDALFPYAHAAAVEIMSTTLDGLRAHGEIGSPSEWARYQYAHLEVLVDRSGGEVQRILDAKEWLPAEERDRVVREALGAYANATYRSLRYGTTLDAAESVPFALTAVFALDGRVRPFNKYLEWELGHHPVPGWDADELLPLVHRVVAGDRAAQHELFRRVEHAARGAGYGAEIDDWEPDLAWLRGDAGYRV